MEGDFADERLMPMIIGSRGEGLESAEHILARVRRRLTAAGMRYGKSWEDVFDVSDKNRDGQLTHQEFLALVRVTLRVLPTTICDHDLKVLFQEIDKNGSGTVDVAELIEYVQHGPRRPQDTVAKLKHRMERVRRNLRLAFQSIGGNEMDVRKIFSYVDLDGSTRLSLYEFNVFVRRELGLTRWDIQNTALTEFFSFMDVNGNGTIELVELVEYARMQSKDCRQLGAQNLYSPPETPTRDRKRKSHRQKLADELVLKKSTSLPALCTSPFTNLGRERAPFVR